MSYPRIDELARYVTRNHSYFDSQSLLGTSLSCVVIQTFKFPMSSTNHANFSTSSSARGKSVEKHTEEQLGGSSPAAHEIRPNSITKMPNSYYFERAQSHEWGAQPLALLDTGPVSNANQSIIYTLYLYNTKSGSLLTYKQQDTKSTTPNVIIETRPSNMKCRDSSNIPLHGTHRFSQCFPRCGHPWTGLGIPAAERDGNHSIPEPAFADDWWLPRRRRKRQKGLVCVPAR